MRYFISFILLLGYAHACIGHGSLHLTEPVSTVYCVEGNTIVWAVTYSIPWQLLVVENSVNSHFWDLPLMENTTYRDQATVKHGKIISSLRYKLYVGKRVGDWIPVTLTGAP